MAATRSSGNGSIGRLSGRPPGPSTAAVHSGAFIFDEPAVLDQRLYLIAPKVDVDDTVLAAYLASSFYPLAIETNADMGPGAGVLTLSTDGLRALPVIDLRKVTSSRMADSIKERASLLFGQLTVEAAEYPTCSEIRMLDEAFLEAIGVPAARAVELSGNVAAFAGQRVRKSRLRSVARRTAKEADLAAVAETVASAMRAWWTARRFPEDFLAGGNTEALSLPATALTLDIDILLNQMELEIRSGRGEQQYRHTMDSHVGELLVRSLQLGRRFLNLPVDPANAIIALDQLDQLLIEFEQQLNQLITRTGLGSRHDAAIRNPVLQEPHIQIEDLFLPLRSGVIHVPAI